MPKVSVIVPVYNVDKYLGECLDSVLRQKLKEIEVICVDDGSTDGSPAILAEHARKDPRIKVVTQANGGLSAARNAGMDIAIGEYICFVDSDDWLVDNALERCVEICERDMLDLLIFGCHVKADSGVTGDAVLSKIEAYHKYYRLPEAMCGHVMSGSHFLLEAVKAGGYYPSVPLRIMRREILVRSGLRFPVGLIHEDEYFSPLLLSFSGRVEALDEKLYVRRLRAGSIMTETGDGSMKRHFLHTLLIYVRLKNDTRKICVSSEGRIAIDKLLKRRYRYLADSVCRANVSVADMWHGAKSTVRATERLGLFGGCMRLAALVAEKKCGRRLRKLAGCIKGGG